MGQIPAGQCREKEGKARRYTERDGRGDFRTIDDEVWNLILREVNADLLENDRSDHTIFVEFARAHNVQALQCFDKGILEQGLILYLEVSFDTCWARNVARHEATPAADGDDHLVPREAMETLYGHDDQDALLRYLADHKIPFMVVNNEAEGEEHLEQQVDALFRTLY